jgi:hypothetical protein
MNQTFRLPKTGRERIAANLHAFVLSMLPGKELRVEVCEYRKRRSDAQNNALWSIAYPALEKATGHGVNDWHEYMLGEKYGWVETNLFGKRKLKPARTTTTGYNGEDCKLSTVEFAEFFSFIQQRAMENGVYIEDPDPMHSQRERLSI